jgi:hypothetical protein
MASDEELSYLQPDFDPSSLTVPRLRNVLLTHGISHPSSAKKADLVQLFHDQLKPQAKRILAARKRTQRSSKGIEDAASSLASSMDTEEEAADEPAPMPSPAKKPRGRPKKTAAQPDDSESTLVPVPAAKPAARSKSRGRSIKAKTVEPATTPGFKKEPSDPVQWVKPAKDSPFSRENPFQSGGSSPPSAPATLAAKRRKTTDAAEEKEPKKRASSGRRKTDQTPAPKSEATVVRRRTTKMPIQEVVSDGFDPDVTEEFAPDEQAELDDEIRAGNMAVVPVRRTAAGERINWKSPVLFLLCLILAGVSGVWRQEKLNVGYCGIGESTKEINGIEIPPWADSVRPQCEQCPQHAICRENMKTDCDNGFVLRQNPLSLGGLLPFVPSCEPDGEKAKRVKAVADRMEDKLRDRRAQVECGSPDATGNPVSVPEMSEEELKSLVAKDRSKRMTPEEFDNLFEDSIPELAERDEIVVTLDE